MNLNDYVCMDTILPAGKLGKVTVVHSTAGKHHYARLFIDDVFYMSDTEQEHLSNALVLERARGRVLISGLGIGMILMPICRSPSVESVHVLEHEQDVIDYVRPHLVKALEKDSHKLTCERASVFEWENESGQMYDCIYHDIWARFDQKAQTEFESLKERYSVWLSEGGWIGGWTGNIPL